MSVPIVHEGDIDEVALPGRYMRWLVNAERLGAKHLSVCVIRVLQGRRSDRRTPIPTARN